MKFTIETKPLVDAVKTLSTIPYRKGIECSEFVAVGRKKGAVTLRLAAELIGYAEVASDTTADAGIIHVDRGPLFPFLLSFESGGPDSLTCELDGDKLKMKGGHRTATFTRAEVKGAYPDHLLRDEKKVEWTDKQTAALAILKHYVCTDAISPELTAIAISPKKKAMFASSRLAIAAYWDSETLPMAGAYAASLVDFHGVAKGIYRATKDAPGIRVSFGKTQLTQLLKTETANFPYTKAAAAFEGCNMSAKIKVEAGALAEVVARLKACSGEALDSLSVQMTAKAGTLELVTKTVSATIRETLKAKTTGDCQATMLWGTLHPLVSSLAGDTVVNFGWEAGPYHVWAKDSVYILSAKKAQ